MPAQQPIPTPAQQYHIPPNGPWTSSVPPWLNMMWLCEVGCLHTTKPETTPSNIAGGGQWVFRKGYGPNGALTGPEKFGLPEGTECTGWLVGRICLVCDRDWVQHNMWDCNHAPVAGGQPDTSSFGPWTAGTAVLTSALQDQVSVYLGGIAGGPPPPTPSVLTPAVPTPVDDEVGDEEAPFYNDGEEVYEDTLDNDDEDDTDFDDDDDEDDEGEPPSTNSDPFAPSPVEPSPGPKRPGPSYITSKVTKGPPPTRTCSTCGTPRVDEPGAFVVTKDGLYMCPRCHRQFSMCSFCGWQCPADKFEGKVWVHVICPDCAPTKRMRLNVKQLQQFVPKTDVLKNRRDKVWTKRSR